MNRLPKEVGSWIYDFFYNERSVAYIKIDAQLRIAAKGGNLEHYGLSSLRIGKPVADQLEFMEGLLPSPELPYHVAMVELPSGRAADLHLFAGNACVWLLLLDATAERDNKQRLQQKAYEMTLLEERERELNARLQSTNEALRKSQEGLSREYQRAESLLLNILPAPIAERLKAHKKIADNHAEVSVLFADIVGFTERTRTVGAVTTLAMLNYFFKAADRLSERYGCEKIKTIGDCVMVVAGLPTARSDHAKALARYALELRKVVKRERFAGEPQVDDLWGETVNLASRIQTSAEPD